MLRTLIRPDQKDWVDRLPDIEFAYNTSVHPAIGVTPFELHHGGRKGRIFADLFLPRPADIDAACSPALWKYRELLTQAGANMQKAQVRMPQQANRRCVPCPIPAGDLVWVSAEEFALEQDVSRKLLPKWFGPWSVTAAAGDDPDGASFVINIPEHLTVHPVFHASKLATYTPAKSDDFPDRRSQDPPSMDGHQEVDRAISDRKYGSKPRQYKVTFKACDGDDTRWISGADLKASAPLIYARYEKRRLAQEASRPAPPTRTVVPPSDRQLRPRRMVQCSGSGIGVSCTSCSCRSYWGRTVSCSCATIYSQVHLGDTPHDLTDADFEELAKLSEGFSGSDIAVSVKDVLFEPVRKTQEATHFRMVADKDGKRKYMACSPGDARKAIESTMEDLYKQGKGDLILPPPIVKSDFLKVLARQRPTVSKSDLEVHERFTKEFGEEG
ncbi:hypothetical protein CBR_g38916 [Chara braunii]|uniref:Uncharacterized protein n=1 Tax=Chara braunii TaxID=69332 RepID=A0A388LQN7_CHABU|nr:hypothetical protein CBR_g38916 [Chara braunii]|eukprot:GBG84634.1 hypothetical protein CBR_g38916 [Chara braunii]